MKSTTSQISTTIHISPLLSFTTLTKKDLDWLARSYITPELAERAKIGRVDTHDGAQMVGRKPTAKQNYAGLVFPYFWPGEPYPGELRLRRDEPDLEQQSDGSTKEKGKYLSAPGRGNTLYFPPGTPPEHLTDATIGVVITEGEKKALALSRYFSETSEERLVIALSGVWNFRGTVGNEIAGNGQKVDVKGVIPDFDKIQWDGRPVWIVFDTNVATNESVRAARNSLAKELTRRGALVKRLDLPTDIEGVNGIDDLLVLKGADFVSGLFASLEAAMRKETTRTIESFVFHVSEQGVIATELNSTQKIKVCGPLWIEADTRTARGDDWGRLLVFRDSDGREKSWVMPRGWLAKERTCYLEKLMNMGLDIMQGQRARNLLHSYLSETPEKRAECVSRVGWAGNAFVFPDATISGKDRERIYLQESSGVNNLLVTSGLLTQWQEAIAHKCIGNSRLVFAASAGFAASLLTPLGIEGGGFHLMGDSSQGKSTSLYVAGSVWGGGGKDGYLETWKGTATGTEFLAEYHNDNLLCLDEIGEANAREIGSIVYMIAHGRGKNRGAREGGLRRSTTWTTLAFSTGEKTLKAYMLEAGDPIKKGQEVRLLNLPADAGAGLGAFENLHGFDPGPDCPPKLRGKDFADHLKAASQKYFGTPIRAFLSHMIEHQMTAALWQRFVLYKEKFIKQNVKQGADEIAGRAADRFAVVGFAGEIASEWDITGWPMGDATKAAARLFNDWQVYRDKSEGGEDGAIARVFDFIQRHGASRFQYIDSNNKPISDDRIFNRAGFKRCNEEGEIVEYAISSEVFRTEVCAGLEDKEIQDVARALLAKNHLTKGDGSNLAAKYPVKGLPRARYYVIQIPTENTKNSAERVFLLGQLGRSDGIG